MSYDPLSSINIPQAERMNQFNPETMDKVARLRSTAETAQGVGRMQAFQSLGIGPGTGTLDKLKGVAGFVQGNPLGAGVAAAGILGAGAILSSALSRKKEDR